MPTALCRLLHRPVDHDAHPRLPHGKPAGVPCVQLDEASRCRLFGRAERPAVCASLVPSPEMCGSTREQALRWLATLEAQTLPTIASTTSSNGIPHLTPSRT